MNLLNLTPHAINVVDLGITIPPSGMVARMSVTRTYKGIVEGIPIYTVKRGNPVDLPNPKEGIGFIVSTLIRDSLPERMDLFSPGDLVRNELGQPIGCKNLDSN